MKNLTKKIEFVANIAIIVVAVLVCVVLVKNYLLADRSKTDPRDMRVAAGTKLSLADVDWAKNGQTLLLVLQKGCRYCSESAPFYQRLVRETAGRENLRLIAVLPQETDEGKKYLSDLGLAIDEVRQAELDSVGVKGTPTLILINNAGVVVDSWVGKLPPEQESKVLERLQAKSVASK
jgi:thioredoxin-related protein